MKTRLDTILETVSFILEVKRKSTKGMRTRDRAAALIRRAGGLGTEMSDRILDRLDPTVQKEVRRDIRQGEQDLDDDNRGRWQRENR
jgi:hypothetical protein